MADVSTGLFEGAKSAVTLVIGLVGGMCFMLGIMKVAFDGGLRDAIARLLAPLLRRMFPDVPADHPAMGAMVMNMACNIMGLGNAATPFGLKAMVELSKLNPHPGTASNAMVLFLAINTSAITLMPPTGTIFVRSAAGSAHPEAVWIPTLIATTCSTLAAVSAYYLLRRLTVFQPPATGTAAAGDGSPPPDFGEVEIPAASGPREPMGLGRSILVYGSAAAVLVALVLEGLRLAEEVGASGAIKTLVQTWSFPLLIGGLLLIGVAGRVRVYDSMVEGAKEGLEVAVRIVPYLVAILTAVAMFRESGALDMFIALVSPLTTPLGVPAEVLPMALLRPFSGSGAFGIMSETLTAYGPDSFIGLLTSTLQGSTETTFYVLALYLGAARVADGRHTLAACLTGDVAGFVGAVAACHVFFG
ncbi:MAG: spore maturation protein [Deltaproteobacteria bacterium]|nr:spore maturation protein [Deltaproteobacteria bacterium]MBW2417701.1 spore maturation protein [Deltaproteobacteria bacterium]